MMNPMAQALRAKGLAVWDVEYRRIGTQGGGYPATFQDVAASVGLPQSGVTAVAAADVNKDGFIDFYFGRAHGAGTFALANAASYRSQTVTDTGTSVTLAVTTKDLTWTGTGGAAWDVNTTTNWSDAVPNPEKFFAGDTVTFGDGPTQVAVTVTSGVSPWKTTVNSASNYTFTSATNGIASSSIVASASLTGSPTVPAALRNGRTRWVRSSSESIRMWSALMASAFLRSKRAGFGFTSRRSNASTISSIPKTSRSGPIAQPSSAR